MWVCCSVSPQPLCPALRTSIFLQQMHMKLCQLPSRRNQHAMAESQEVSLGGQPNWRFTKGCVGQPPSNVTKRTYFKVGNRWKWFGGCLYRLQVILRCLKKFLLHVSQARQAHPHSQQKYTSPQQVLSQHCWPRATVVGNKPRTQATDSRARCQGTT